MEILADYSWLAWVIALMAILLALLSLSQKWKGQSAAESSARDAKVEGCLATAIACGSLFDITISGENEETAHLKAVCMDMSADSLHMESDSLAVEPFIGGEAKVSFALTRGPHKGIFRFDSTVKGFFPEENGYTMEIARPRSMERVQRRTFMRCVPPPSSVVECHAWQLGDNDIALERAIDISAPHFSGTDLEIRDISSGGMKLFISSPFVRADEDGLVSPQGDPLRYFLVYLELNGQMGYAGLAIWLMGEVRLVKHVDKGVEVGLRFLRWRLPSVSRQPWNRPGEGGEVEAVHAWVMQADLARRREEVDFAFQEGGIRAHTQQTITDLQRAVVDDSCFRAQLEHTLEVCRTQNERFSCLGIELLDLEGIFAVCGKREVEHVLNTVGMLVSKSVRVGDIVGRMNDYHFYVLMPGADSVGVNMVREILRQREQTLVFSLDSGAVLRLAVRIGAITVAAGALRFSEVQPVLDEVNGSMQSREEEARPPLTL